MEPILIYLVKSILVLGLFYATYYFLLRKNTFFTTNRWFFLVGIACSVFLPLITFQKTVWVEPEITSEPTFVIQEVQEIPMVEVAVQEVKQPPITLELILTTIHLIGVAVFLFQLLIELYSLRKIIRKQKVVKNAGFDFIEVNSAIAPFSFFNKIVYNSALFQSDELHNIIEHEKVHAKQLHSLDVLIARLQCVLFWFNPLVWMYKKAMIQNLEFIADQQALAVAKDKKSYLLTLLKITTAEKQVALTNHFYQSLIKKRIVMLHKNQSKKQQSWNYFLVLPALIFFMVTYQIEVVAQVKENKTHNKKIKIGSIEQEVTYKTTNQELKEASQLFNQEFGTLLEFSKIKRNKNGDIVSIKAALKDKKSKTDIKTVYEILGDSPIKSFNIFVGRNPTNNKIEFGYGKPEFSKNVVVIDLKSKDSIYFQKDSIYFQKDSIYLNQAVFEPKIATTSTTYSANIDALTSQADLDKYKAMFKKYYNIDVKINNLSRNRHNQIIAIDITLTDKIGTAKKFIILEGEPIKPFNIFAKTTDKEEQTFGFGASKENQHLKNHFAAVEKNKNKTADQESQNTTKKGQIEFTLNMDGISTLVKTNFSVQGDLNLLENVLLVLDGKVITIEDLDQKTANSIKSVTVVKRASNKNAELEVLFENYGEKAKNGIYLIETEKK